MNDVNGPVVISAVEGWTGDWPSRTSRAAGQYADLKSNARTPLCAATQTRKEKPTSAQSERATVPGARPAMPVLFPRRAPMSASAAEALADPVDRGVEQHEEQRRKDEQDQREEDL